MVRRQLPEKIHLPKIIFTNLHLMNPEINDLSIDLSMFATSLVTLRQNMTYVDFDSMLRTIEDANNRAKLEVLLEKVQVIYSQGTDLASAFEHSIFDIVQEQGENF